MLCVCVRWADSTPFQMCCFNWIWSGLSSFVSSWCITYTRAVVNSLGLGKRPPILFMLDAPNPSVAVKEHQTAINGFIVWVLTWLGLGMFVLWSTFDEEALHKWQFTYYPDKYWAVACPAIFCMIFMYSMMTYFLSHLQNTKPLSDAFCITDGDARINTRTGLGTLTEGSKSTSSSVPAISDISVGVTSRVLFQPWK